MCPDPPPELEGGGAEMDPLDLESKTGPDLSTVTAFFNRVPFLISPRRASRPAGITAGGPDGKLEGAPAPKPGGGGGGGGGGGPAMIELSGRRSS